MVQLSTVSSRSDLTGRPFNIGTVQSAYRGNYISTLTQTQSHTHASIALPLHSNDNPIVATRFLAETILY